ncbi:MAG: helix-turn-helix domain-containing protein [Puniceicoccales bacterium]
MSQNFLSALLLTPPQPRIISHALHGLGGVTDETFCLPDQWMLHFYQYSGRIRVREREFALQPGCATLIPPGSETHFTYRGESPHLYAHFYLPDGADSEPLYWPANPRIESLRELLEGALSFHRTNSQRSTARLWDVLLGLAFLREEGSPRTQSQEKLDECLRLMSAQISTQLPISQIARQVGISPNQLTRLFREKLNTTPVAYRQELRMDRACTLLRHSDLPVKAIACTVGMPDLQAFNKTFRKCRGVSPREYRKNSRNSL